MFLKIFINMCTSFGILNGINGTRHAATWMSKASSIKIYHTLYQTLLTSFHIWLKYIPYKMCQLHTFLNYIVVYLSKYCMLVVEMITLVQGEEELAGIVMGTSICHGNQTTARKFETTVKFILQRKYKSLLSGMIEINGFHFCFFYVISLFLKMKP